MLNTNTKRQKLCCKKLSLLREFSVLKAHFCTERFCVKISVILHLEEMQNFALILCPYTTGSRQRRRSIQKNHGTNRSTPTSRATTWPTSWTASPTWKSAAWRSTHSAKLSDQSPTPKNVSSWPTTWQTPRPSSRDAWHGPSWSTPRVTT